MKRVRAPGPTCMRLVADDSICVLKLWLTERDKANSPLNYSRNPLLRMEPECSWELAVGLVLSHIPCYHISLRFILILSSYPHLCPQRGFSFSCFSTTNFCICFCHVCYKPHLSYAPWFDHPNNIQWGIQIKKLLYPPVPSSLLSPDVLPMMWYIGDLSASHSSHLYVLTQCLR
jgi:hypothetical protein